MVMSPQEWLAAQQNGNSEPEEKKIMSPQEWMQANAKTEEPSILDKISEYAPIFTTLPAVGKVASYVADKALDVGADIMDSTAGQAVKTAFDYMSKPADALAEIGIFGNQYTNDYMQENPDVVQALNDMREQTGGPKLDPNQYDVASPKQDNIVEAVKDAWDNGASYKSAMDKPWVKENPVKADLIDLGLKIGADPMWVATPANIVKGVKGAAEMTGIAKPIAKVAGKIADTMPVKTAVALGEDIIGKNRLAPNLNIMKGNIADDAVDAKDIYQKAIQRVKTDYGDDVAKVMSDAIEADKRITPTLSKEEIVQKFLDGDLAKAVAEGKINKQTAAETLRDVGENTIPKYLRPANEASTNTYIKKLFPDGMEANATDFPYYVYRDQVLGTIKDENVRSSVGKAVDMITDKLSRDSKSLYDAGLLTDETMAKYANGTHLRRSMGNFETPDKFLEAVRKTGNVKDIIRAEKAVKGTEMSKGLSGAQKINVNDFAARLNLSQDTLDKLGVIRDPEYLVVDTLRRSSQNLRKSEFLDSVATGWARDGRTAVKLNANLPKSRQYFPVPSTEINGVNPYGKLAGQWVPKDVLDLVHGTVVERNPSKMVAKWEKLVSSWKALKLINPASISRNMLSGIPMTNVNGEVPLTAFPKHMARVMNEFKKGDTTPFMKEIRRTGVFDDAWQKQELQNLVGDSRTVLQKGMEKGMDAFGWPDKFWRAVTYSYHRSEGKSIEYAANMARKAQLDYSSAPEWVNTLGRTGVVPFAKFPFLMGKETAKALYNRPAEVTKWYKPSKLDENQKDREKLMPDYMKQRTLMPLWKGTVETASGKKMPVKNNLDLTYLLPFNSDVSLGNPALEMLQIARTGRNSLGMDVIRPNMTDKDKIKAYAKQAVGAFGPSFPLPIEGNYAGDKLTSAIKGEADYKGRRYGVINAVANVGFGIKNSPINDEELLVQQQANYQRQQMNIGMEMAKIAKDQSMTKEQKKAKILEYAEDRKRLDQSMKEVGDAYKRIKAKEKGR